VVHAWQFAKALQAITLEEGIFELNVVWLAMLGRVFKPSHRPLMAIFAPYCVKIFGIRTIIPAKFCLVWHKNRSASDSPLV
jgi:hypothetical protein